MTDGGVHGLECALDGARIAARLAATASAADVTRVLLEDVRAATGAVTALLAMPAEDGEHLLLAATGLHPDLGEGGSYVPLGSSLAVAAVYRSGQAAYAEDRPAVLEAFAAVGCPPPCSSALAAFPVRTPGGVLAAAALGFEAPGPFPAGDRAALDELGWLMGAALDRARLRDAERSARARLEEVLERAEVASRAKDEFLAMLSHELRNPLAPIVTALQLMRQRRGDALPAHEHEVVERQVAHLVRLVDDLLDVSRVTRGTVRLEPRPVGIEEIVARAVETASPLVEERRHALSLDLAPGLRVRADAARIAQVIANLLTNAAKYTDPGGRVAVHAAADGAMARIAVQDSGIGISPALLPHLFDPFVQGERALDRSPGGLGLGLAIARSLVDLHGGRIAAESGGPGAGSTFTFWIPLAEDAPGDPAPAAGAPEEPAPAAAPARLLVVDDNVDAAELLAEALRSRGHEVHVAFDGASALALAREIRPRVALLDLGLPVMDGYELARRLQDAPATAGLALVAVTGYGQDVDRRASADAGFRAHFVKPVELERICEAVDELARP
jgi:signal transduction histidine kinase/CheY-like chemotaxis protein